jgi:hypothetical protein
VTDHGQRGPVRTLEGEIVGRGVATVSCTIPSFALHMSVRKIDPGPFCLKGFGV